MSTDQKVELTRKVWESQFYEWLNHELLTWHWYLALVISLLIFAVWWYVVDKNRLLEISFYGLIINVTATLLDDFGVSAGLWTYPNVLLPVSTGLTPANYIVIPVIAMMIYQYSSSWKSYLIIWLIVAGVISFIVDPILIKINYYELVRWKNIYSYPVWIVMAVYARTITKFFVFKNK